MRWVRLIAPLLVVPFLLAATTVEKDDAGRVMEKYTVVNGVKNGPFTRFYDGEKVRAKGTYKANRLEGEMLLYYPDGKKLSKALFRNGLMDGTVQDYDRVGAVMVSATYKKGELSTLSVFDGYAMFEQKFKAGGPRCPRRYAEIQEAWSLIDTLPRDRQIKDNPADLDRLAALRRLQAYRALVGVPYEGLTLDADMHESAEVAAEILQAIGRLDHDPPNPGWPAAKYRAAFAGTRSSNLATSPGGMTCAASVDLFMDDSNPMNINAVGHRRWCLNPAMLKVDFGRSANGKFVAMKAHDSSRKETPSDDFFAFPPAGLVPPNYFKAGYAWSVSLNMKNFVPPKEKNVNVSVFRKSANGEPDTQLKLKMSAVDTVPYGGGPAIVFSPDNVDVSPGSRYLVKISGLIPKNGRQSTLEYLVWFTR